MHKDADESEEGLELITKRFPIGTEVQLLGGQGGVVVGYCDAIALGIDHMVQVRRFDERSGDPLHNLESFLPALLKPVARSDALRAQDVLMCAQYPLGCHVRHRDDHTEWRVTGYVTTHWYNREWWRDGRWSVSETSEHPPLVRMKNCFGVEHVCTPQEIEPYVEQRVARSPLRRLVGRMLCAIGLHRSDQTVIAWDKVRVGTVNLGGSTTYLVSLVGAICGYGRDYIETNQLAQYRCGRRGCSHTEIWLIWSDGFSSRSVMVKTQNLFDRARRGEAIRRK